MKIARHAKTLHNSLLVEYDVIVVQLYVIRNANAIKTFISLCSYFVCSWIGTKQTVFLFFQPTTYMPKYIKIFISYFKEKTSRTHYKDHSFNAV